MPWCTHQVQKYIGYQIYLCPPPHLKQKAPLSRPPLTWLRNSTLDKLSMPASIKGESICRKVARSISKRGFRPHFDKRNRAKVKIIIQSILPRHLEVLETNPMLQLIVTWVLRLHDLPQCHRRQYSWKGSSSPRWWTPGHWSLSCTMWRRSYDGSDFWGEMGWSSNSPKNSSNVLSAQEKTSKQEEMLPRGPSRYCCWRGWGCHGCCFPGRGWGSTARSLRAEQQ